MAGHSRSKNGVASLAYARPSTSSKRRKKGVDARLRGHDEEALLRGDRLRLAAFLARLAHQRRLEQHR